MRSSWVLSLVLVGCGSVNTVHNDAPTGDTNGDSSGDAMAACGVAGASCCASNVCNAGLSCTTGDQVCRATMLFIGGQDSANNTAIVARGSGTAFTIDQLGTGSVVAVWGTSSSDVWALANGPVGAAQTSFLRHWNGSIWEAPTSQSGFYYGLWGDAQNNYWAVNNSGGAIHWTGSAWAAPVLIAQSIVFTQIWGNSATNVWAIGGSTVGHYDTSWGSSARGDFSVFTRGSISGRKSTGDFFSGGQSNNAPAVLHRAGTMFTVEPVPGCGDTRGIWAGPDDAWAMTGPLIASGSCVAQPKVVHLESGTWTDKGGLPNATGSQAMWGSSNRDIWVAGAVANGPAAFHYDGTGWTSAYTPTTGATNFFTVWGTGGPN